jgi:hypothetical protein
MSRRIKLSTCRRAMAGMLHYAHRIPTIPVARSMSLGNVADARTFLQSPPSWSSIFIRAYALVCTQFASLRRAWISWPSPYLYEHPHTVCALAVEREWLGESVVLMGKVFKPEMSTAEEIQRHVKRYQEADIRSISPFRLSLRFGRLPAFLQRLLLWHKLDVSGKRRVKYIGTFGVTNYGMFGAEPIHPLGPQTTVLAIGPLKPSGEITVKLIYDHRVLDGAYVARCLNRLEEVLHTNILAELKQPSRLAS